MTLTFQPIYRYSLGRRDKDSYTLEDRMYRNRIMTNTPSYDSDLAIICAPSEQSNTLSNKVQQAVHNMPTFRRESRRSNQSLTPPLVQVLPFPPPTMGCCPIFHFILYSNIRTSTQTPRTSPRPHNDAGAISTCPNTRLRANIRGVDSVDRVGCPNASGVDKAFNWWSSEYQRWPSLWNRAERPRPIQVFHPNGWETARPSVPLNLRKTREDEDPVKGVFMVEFEGEPD